MQGLKERKQEMFSLVLAGVGLLAMTGVASAAALTLSSLNPGILNGGNYSVQVNSNTATTPCINFYNGASPDACGSTSNFTLNAPSDAIFGTVGTTVGTSQDFLLSNQTGTAPGNDPYNGLAFLAINGITFDITSIVVPNVVGCPPTSAPGACSYGDFTFTQLDFNTLGGCPGGINPCGQVNVGFTARGIGYRGSSTTGYTPYTFSWSSQFINETTGDLSIKANGGAVVDAVSFTASPTGVVPEPVSMALIGGGLIALAALRRRKRV